MDGLHCPNCQQRVAKTNLSKIIFDVAFSRKKECLLKKNKDFLQKQNNFVILLEQNYIHGNMRLLICKNWWLQPQPLHLPHLSSQSHFRKNHPSYQLFFPNRLSNMRGGADWGVATTSFCILTYTCFHEYHLALVWWYRGRSCCGRTPSSPARLEFLTFFLTPSLGRVKIVWVIFHLFSVKSSWKVIFGTNFFWVCNWAYMYFWKFLIID